MSRAVKCDMCECVVEYVGSISISVDYVKDAKGQGTVWNGIDLCRDCLAKPFIEIIDSCCNNFPAPEKST